MSIKNELDVIGQTWIPQNASKVRQAIHDILIKTYDTASENGNANMEVEIARGTHPNLRSRLEEVDNKQKQTASQLVQTEQKKLNRNENESIPMAMLSPEIKEALNDGEWNVNINTSEIEDGAVTVEKLDSTELLHLSPMETGKYVGTNGAIGTSPPYAYTSNILLEAGKTIRLRAKAGSAVSVISQWSADDKFIKNLVNGSGVTGADLVVHEYEYTPEIDMYVRLSYIGENKAVIYTDPDRFLHVFDNINELRSYLYEDISDDILFMETGKFIGLNGTIINSLPYVYTESIPLKVGERIVIETIAQKDVVAVISEWNSEGEFVGTLVAGEEEGTQNVGIYEYASKEDKLIRFSFNDEMAGAKIIKYKNLIPPSFIETTDSSVQTLNILKEVDLKEEYKHLVRNVLCIGDSLTNGAYYGNKADGVPANGLAISENYPYYLKKMTGWETTNAGRNGATATSWYESFISNYDYTEYDTVVIGLGTNYGLTDTLAEDTTLDEGETYLDYADTHTGNYCKIIKTIKEQNPNTKIFLMNIFGGGLDTGSGWNYDIPNKVINDIAEKYNLPTVIDIRHLKDIVADNGSILHPFGNVLHFGKVGNIHLAKTVEREIVDYIYNHSIDFDKALI